MVVAYGLTITSMRRARGERSSAATSARRSSAAEVSATSGPLQEAALAEVRDHARQDDGHERDDRVERCEVLLARDLDVHPPDRGDQRQRQEDDRERREDAEDLVGAVRDGGLVRLLERFHDLLVVLEHVPDALGGVDDVVEVDVEVVRDVARLGALEIAERRPLRADDLAEVDDLLLDV